MSMLCILCEQQADQLAQMSESSEYKDKNYES